MHPPCTSRRDFFAALGLAPAGAALGGAAGKEMPADSPRQLKPTGSDLGSVYPLEQVRAFAPGVLAHAANSAATLGIPEARLDLVRCGVAVYGLRMRMGWYAMPGAVGMWLWMMPASGRGGSVSVWASEEDLAPTLTYGQSARRLAQRRHEQRPPLGRPAGLDAELDPCLRAVAAHGRHDHGPVEQRSAPGQQVQGEPGQVCLPEPPRYELDQAPADELLPRVAQQVERAAAHGHDEVHVVRGDHCLGRLGHGARVPAEVAWRGRVRPGWRVIHNSTAPAREKRCDVARAIRSLDVHAIEVDAPAEARLVDLPDANHACASYCMGIQYGP